jgi:hypothetical protein
MNLYTNELTRPIHQRVGEQSLGQIWGVPLAVLADYEPDSVKLPLSTAGAGLQILQIAPAGRPVDPTDPADPAD